MFRVTSDNSLLLFISSSTVEGVGGSITERAIGVGGGVAIGVGIWASISVRIGKWSICTDSVSMVTISKMTKSMVCKDNASLLAGSLLHS